MRTSQGQGTPIKINATGHFSRTPTHSNNRVPLENLKKDRPFCTLARLRSDPFESVLARVIRRFSRAQQKQIFESYPKAQATFALEL